MSADEKYMYRCLELAGNGLGHVAPNPMVGAVLVHNERIIGEGFHRQFGEAHAEVNAITAAIAKHGEDILRQSVLYVNLEPCSHIGKTPACTDLILEKKIPAVVIGCEDPFEKVRGEGIKKLISGGVNVMHPILEKESREINKRFMCFHEKQRPYIILKYAQSQDGFISPETLQEHNRWITNEYSRTLVHKWRSEEQAIMIGTNTAKNDNPFLTVRDWKGKNPVRIMIDNELKVDVLHNIYDLSAPTLIYNGVKNEEEKKHEFIRIDFKQNVPDQILASLHEKNIQSLIVEGGTKLLQSFIDENRWDEARIFTGNKFLEEGIKAPVIRGKVIAKETILDDKLVILKPQSDI
jgi:diaminohydroxyphosphoribosylaminopyrimidine deaminase/5-amino-6-(5-phosphoribosylamino)uracil reductase